MVRGPIKHLNSGSILGCKLFVFGSERLFFFLRVFKERNLNVKILTDIFPL